MCGPPLFRDKLYAELVRAGANPDRVFQESFLSNSGSDLHERIDSADVVFSRTGKTVQWTAEEDLDTAGTR